MKSVVAINGVKASSYVGVRIQARVQPPRAARVAVVQCVAEDEAERLRLNNLSPQEGARRKKTRKGRGYGAGQGGTAGYGMRGQKSRSGSGIRPGFEGGQTPLYRKLPKLRGIAGGMGHGLPDYVRARSVFSSSSSSSLSMSSLSSSSLSLSSLSSSSLSSSSLSSSSLSLLLSCTPHGVTASRPRGLVSFSPFTGLFGMQVTINVRDLNKFAGEGGEISLEMLKESGILNLSTP